MHVDDDGNASVLLVATLPSQSLAASSLLQRNLLIYGLGGLIAPFVGIKIIDVIITAIGLA